MARARIRCETYFRKTTMLMTPGKDFTNARGIALLESETWIFVSFPGISM